MSNEDSTTTEAVGPASADEARARYALVRQNPDVLRVVAELALAGNRYPTWPEIVQAVDRVCGVDS